MPLQLPLCLKLVLCQLTIDSRQRRGRARKGLVMAKENVDILLLLRSILAELDRENFYLAAVYIEKAIEIIQRGDVDVNDSPKMA